MGKNCYLYHVNYQNYEEELCALDIRTLFKRDLKGKVLLTDKKIDPSISPYIKERIEVIHRAPTFDYLLELLKRHKETRQKFMVKYVSLHKKDPNERKGRHLSKAIGLRIIGLPSFDAPNVIYGTTYYEGSWYFGLLEANKATWKAHNEKPYSYSSALGINLAKVLVNAAASGDLNKKLIDPCCGVGTVLMEAAYGGYNIEGRELKEKVAEHARKNLSHFNYSVKVTTGDIGAIEEKYDGCIVDLPYGNFSHTTEAMQREIILNALRISDRTVIVASEDISPFIEDQSIQIIDRCRVGKAKKSKFNRFVYVCSK